MGLGQGIGEFPGGGGQSPGGTSLPVPSFAGLGIYWNGSVWVATTGNLVTAFSNGPGVPTQINGLAGSPDVVPSSPGAYNDEFDSDFNGVNSPWTAFNSPDTSNTSDFLSHLHLRKNTTGQQMSGWYQSVPSTPFTMTCKMTDIYIGGNPNRAGIFMCSTSSPQAASGTIVDVGISQNSGAQTLYSNTYTGYNGSGSAGANLDYSPQGVFTPVYLRILVTDSTHWTFSWSRGGQVYASGSVFNAGFVPLCCGVMVNPDAGSGRGEATFDWVRFT